MSNPKVNNLPTCNNPFRTFSIILAAALELCGYRYRAIKQRQENLTNLEKGNDIFIVGSKAEGIGEVGEVREVEVSDYDVMIVLKYCICADDISDIVLTNSAQPLLLLTEIDMLNSGYTKLKVAFPDDLQNLHNEHLFSSFVKQDGIAYLSSALFKGSRPVDGKGVTTDFSGPALSFTSKGPKIDIVPAITYTSRILLQEWLARPRFHGWPNKDTLLQLAKLDWHLVPVGPQKDSFMEFRICFTLGEQYLVKTFNITQLHLLILLKQVMNEKLKPLCSAFSSYTAKNIVFWLIEILAPENFKVENLSSLLMMSLQMLRVAVDNEQLQNYMIPSRNLLKGKMSRDEKDNIIKLLDSFIYCGPGFLMKHSEFSELQESMQKVDKSELAQELQKRNNNDDFWNRVDLINYDKLRSI